MLTFLGTSAAVPTKRRNHIGIALKYDGDVFLFDCGENIQRQMLSTKVSPMRIKSIFITHLHGDHILGLPGLLQSLAFMGRKNKLKIYGPEGIEDIVRMSLNFGYFVREYDIEVITVKTDNPKIIEKTEKYEIIAYPTKHSIESYGYIFKEIKKPRLNPEKAKEFGVRKEDFKKLKNGIPVKSIYGLTVYPYQVLLPPKKGMCLAYSGDTLPIEDFGRYLKNLGCDFLIHEATFDDNLKDEAIETMHSTIGDAVNIAKIAGVKVLFLTHISARYDKEYFNIYKSNAEKYSNEKFKIFIPEDLESYNLKDFL
ncbi:ribonuclease Z [Methanocaldococcus villosus KIN24-T80]|uniref:Ribonuclease Z n=1 Tax=Methanocaldococcus villosus KIN24-T80 TaxID=1069083 RepID=N6V2N1_9EURY|nr:ribonuclease Z [Methanocaldococcus villosus]ENN96513.1 ribonuclease Z [Methanocaldococcus villosus KIN24-T80]